MKGGFLRRPAAVLLLAGAVFALFAASALSAVWTVEREPLIGAELTCGERTYTATGGAFVTRSAVVSEHGDVARVVGTAKPRHARLVGDAGRSYRLVGAGNFNFLTIEGEPGHFNVTFAIVGRKGKVDDVHFRAHVNKTGTHVRFSNTGSCPFE